MLIKVAFPSTQELDTFIGKIQRFGNTSTQIVFHAGAASGNYRGTEFVRAFVKCVLYSRSVRITLRLFLHFFAEKLTFLRFSWYNRSETIFHEREPLFFNYGGAWNLLHILIGGAGCGKSTCLIQHLQKQLKAGEQILTLVPEQFSYEFDQKLYRILGTGCI